MRCQMRRSLSDSRTRPNSKLRRERTPPCTSLELCALVAPAKSLRSISATLSPRMLASRATQAPVTPPPMTSRSNTSLARRSMARRMESSERGSVSSGRPAILSRKHQPLSFPQQKGRLQMTKIRANGIELEYDETGPASGIPFLMINGFGSQMTSWSDEFRQSLSGAGLRFIRFDNRDVGLSQKWHGIVPDMRAVLQAVREGRKPDIPYTLNDMAADAAGLLDALNIESAHIAGASMGGMIAQLVALDHPAKTPSLISIFSTTSDPSLPPSSPDRK